MLLHFETGDVCIVRRCRSAAVCVYVCVCVRVWVGGWGGDGIGNVRQMCLGTNRDILLHPAHCEALVLHAVVARGPGRIARAERIQCTIPSRQKKKPRHL